MEEGFDPPRISATVTCKCGETITFPLPAPTVVSGLAPERPSTQETHSADRFVRTLAALLIVYITTALAVSEVLHQQHFDDPVPLTGAWLLLEGDR